MLRLSWIVFRKEYLEILPTTFSTPLYFSKGELEELAGSPLYKLAKRRAEALKGTHSKLAAGPEELLDAGELHFEP